eukprot:CAMPEP_0113664706 /NCGR_PEP_ID=MMETSP0038_2-20120614/1887_1 /TAXON_ID=2898 /ORGANISM="Cryptomonas paramecium" /LENGTH=169 /DNA_ID=CAMNT_0000579955 /DNA_START=12 /DNA_END=517 /DNA_ORIENTATION=+ /assembly_acc=CAM_ASM_000170
MSEDALQLVACPFCGATVPERNLALHTLRCDGGHHDDRPGAERYPPFDRQNAREVVEVSPESYPQDECQYAPSAPPMHHEFHEEADADLARAIELSLHDTHSNADETAHHGVQNRRLQTWTCDECGALNPEPFLLCDFCQNSRIGRGERDQSAPQRQDPMDFLGAVLGG